MPRENQAQHKQWRNHFRSPKQAATLKLAERGTWLAVELETFDQARTAAQALADVLGHGRRVFVMRNHGGDRYVIGTSPTPDAGADRHEHVGGRA